MANAPAPAFRRGAEASQEASKASTFARTQYFGLENGKSCIVRFLTDHDEWIVVDQHNNVPTKAKPADYEGQNWPERFLAVCRNDPAFAGMYSDCYICDHLVDGKSLKKPSARTYALACLREEVTENGRVIGIKDSEREVTIPAREAKDGKPAQPERKVMEKAVVVVSQGYKNFFSALKGFAGHYGTVLDRDYYIKREGSSTDTEYTIIPLDPIVLEGGKRFDVRDPEVAKRYEHDIDLGQVVADKASDEFYARFFDPRFAVTKEGAVEKTGADPTPKPENEVDGDKMAALASRIKGYTPGGNGGATAPQDPADPHPPQPVGAPTAPTGGMRDFG